MTSRRNDDHSTEFGLWVRDQSVIDSSLGFVATNIDYVWHNYKTGQWMLIEEKRFGVEPRFPQTKMLEIVDSSISDEKYLGLFYLIFEYTSPSDGKMYLQKRNKLSYTITDRQLLMFLQFNEELINYLEHGCCTSTENNRLSP
jgi:hypothetical protein